MRSGSADFDFHLGRRELSREGLPLRLARCGYRSSAEGLAETPLTIFCQRLPSLRLRQDLSIR